MVPRDFLAISAMAYLARFSRRTTRFSRHFRNGLFGEIFSWYHKIFSPFQQWLIWRDFLMVPREFLSISAMAYLARFSRGSTRFSRHFSNGLFGEIFSWYHEIFSPFQQWLIWRDFLVVPQDFLAISTMAYLARFSHATTRFSRHFSNGLFGEIYSWYHGLLSLY